MTIYVTFMGKRTAEAFTRRVYSVPKDCGLGWTPYRIYVTRDAISETAFVNMREFKAYLNRKHLAVVLDKSYSGQRNGKLVPCSP